MRVCVCVCVCVCVFVCVLISSMSVSDSVFLLQDMLCYSGNQTLSIKASTFPIHQQKQEVDSSDI